MSLKWTALALFLVLLAVVGAFVAFEQTGYRTSAQRNEFANAVWGVAGVLTLGLVGWFLARKKGR